MATNPLGRALFSEMYVTPQRPVNAARFTFLDPRARDLLPRLGRPSPDQIVALLRAEAGRERPTTGILTDLVGRTVHPQRGVPRRCGRPTTSAIHPTGTKQVHHPVVGDLDLTFEAMDLTSEPGLQLLAFTAEPGSASQDGLQLLATWAATAQLEADVAQRR